MEVILLERVEKLGQMGDVVRVKDGYARNFLLPQSKALRATDANRQRFENDKAQLEARNLERKNEAQAVADKLDGQSFVIIRQAGEAGQLYGSVSTRDIASEISTGGFSTSRGQVTLDKPIKEIGLHTTRIVLHPEVSVEVTVNVARTEEEAERQAKGEILTGEQDSFEEETLAAEDVFESKELAEAAEAELSDDDKDTSEETEEAPAEDTADSSEEEKSE